MTNPYRPPASNLQRKPKELGSRLLFIPPQSIWLFLFWSVLTLFIYNLFWIYTRTQYFNDASRDHRIPLLLVYAIFTIWISVLVSALLVLSEPDNARLMTVLWICCSVQYFSFVLWSVLFRQKLHNFLELHGHNLAWCSLLLALLLPLVYINFKLSNIAQIRILLTKNQPA